MYIHTVFCTNTVIIIIWTKHGDNPWKNCIKADHSKENTDIHQLDNPKITSLLIKNLPDWKPVFIGRANFTLKLDNITNYLPGYEYQSKG